LKKADVLNSVRKEIKTMSQISHPNTLKYINCHYQGDDIWVRFFKKKNLSSASLTNVGFFLDCDGTL
jgi:hypothetical protein